MSPNLQSRPDAECVERFEENCRALNERIARLALLLGVSLDDAADMSRVLHHAPRLEDTSAVDPLAGESHASQRTAQSWTELRGLLLLRDELEKRCVDEFGPVTAGEILLDVEAQMERQGFRVGADGLDIRGLFGLPHAT